MVNAGVVLGRTVDMRMTERRGNVAECCGADREAESCVEAGSHKRVAECCEVNVQAESCEKLAECCEVSVWAESRE
jgi:hypothetical protein